MLETTTTGNPICELCGNSGYAVTMLLFSNTKKEAWEHEDEKKDHYVCSDCRSKKDVSKKGWHKVR